MRPPLRLLPGMVLLALLGCSFEMSTTMDQKMSLKPGEMKWVAATATVRTQKLVIIVKSPGMPVNVGVVLEEDLDKAKEAMKGGKEPPRALDYFGGTEDAALKIVTHPNKGFAVIIRNGNEESANVHLLVKPY